MDITLNQKEQTRISVLNSVLEYQVPIAQARLSAFSSGVSQGIYKSVVQSDRAFLRIRVCDRC